MREYQWAYMENLARVIELYDPFRDLPEDGAALLSQRREKCRRIQAIIEENNAMLRQHLFPMLDDIASASEEEISHLEDFAAQLGSGGPNQPDLVLHYILRRALVTYARKWGKRDMLIRELYHAGLSLFYMQEIMDRCGQVRYRWKMGLLFGEAASYIKEYDGIADPETRGYIHRSMGNLSLAYGGANLEDAQHKLDAVRRSLQILTDPAYQAKTPSLPWDRYIYTSHQERSSALNALRAGVSDPLVLREVMESAQYVREFQEEDCRKRGVKPMVRWRMGYEAAQYHCGIQPLGALLRWLEEAYMGRDEGDYSEDGIHYNISIPALYADYISQDGEFRLKKKEVLLHMYHQVAEYVRRAPESQVGELLLKYLLQFLQNFVEYPDGIQAKEFLLQLVVCRQPDAYVHFRLTATLTEALASRALSERPALLLGVLGCGDVGQLRARRVEILKFAYENGLLYSIGVLAFNNMLLHIGRSWLEEEREMFQDQVYAGASILARNPSTRPYAATALGYKRFFDGNGGYPAEYDRAANPDRAITDLVGVAADLIQFTDDTNPQNRRPFTLEQAMEKIREGAGTRYDPGMVGLLDGLGPDLEGRLRQVKAQAYEDAFRLLKG